MRLKKELVDFYCKLYFMFRLAEEEGGLANRCANGLSKNISAILTIRRCSAEQCKRGSRELGASKQREDTAVTGVPRLPGVIAAYRVQEKAANVGFDWKTR